MRSSNPLIPTEKNVATSVATTENYGKQREAQREMKQGIEPNKYEERRPKTASTVSRMRYHTYSIRDLKPLFKQFEVSGY